MTAYRRAILVAVAILALTRAATAANPTPVAGDQMLAAGVPTGASPNKDNNLYMLRIFYFDATGALQNTVVSVPGIAVTAGLPNPTAAQAAMASATKAQAIVAAINKAMVAIDPVTINGTKYNTITASVDANTQKGMYNTGQVMFQRINGVVTTVPVLAAFDQTTYTVNGVRQSILFPGGPSAKLGSAIIQTGVNTTGEGGNGKFGFNKASPGGGGGSNNKSMYQGSLNGSGAGTGLSTGVDYSGTGNQSVVGFGFINYASSTPVDYIAAFDPTKGMTDYQVMTTLKDEFDEDFASDGYTASYDLTTDVLSINQLLSSTDMVWSADTDTGLFLDSSTNTVPEPSSLGSLAIGAVGLGLVACGRQRRLVAGDCGLPM